MAIVLVQEGEGFEFENDHFLKGLN